jgi:hypothetical protein
MAAIKGGTVCIYHGGSAAHVREAATRRLLALVDPAIDTLHMALRDDDPKVRASAVKAAEGILNRTGLEAVSKVDVEDKTSTAAIIAEWTQKMEEGNTPIDGE